MYRIGHVRSRRFKTNLDKGLSYNVDLVRDLKFSTSHDKQLFYDIKLSQEDIPQIVPPGQGIGFSIIQYNFRVGETTGLGEETIGDTFTVR